MVDFKNWLWREGERSGGQAVVFDMDGVICNADGRQHFLESAKRDWKSFFEACGNDEVIEETSRLIHLLAPEVSVVLLTGRPLDVQSITTEWLAKHDLRWDLLVMRNRGDYSASLEFKRQTTRQLKARDFELVLAFEDDSHNQAMFQEEGIPCMYIHSGYYDYRNAEGNVTK